MTALQVLQVLGRLPLPISLSKFFYTIFAGPILLYAGEPVCVPVRASPRPCRASKRKNLTTKLPRTTLGTGLARTGTNTGTPREPPKRLLRGWRGT